MTPQTASARAPVTKPEHWVLLTQAAPLCGSWLSVGTDTMLPGHMQEENYISREFSLPRLCFSSRYQRVARGLQPEQQECQRCTRTAVPSESAKWHTSVTRMHGNDSSAPRHRHRAGPPRALASRHFCRRSFFPRQATYKPPKHPETALFNAVSNLLQEYYPSNRVRSPPSLQT